MEDIKILEKCIYCGGHMALRESIRIDDSKLSGSMWLVKFCPCCGGAGAKEVARLHENKSE